MAKVLFVIAKKDFRDIEYFTPKAILENAGYEIVVASNCKTGETAVGVGGGKVKINIELDEVKVGDFDAVVFVGGPGALENLDNSESYRLAQEAVVKNKILAAICIAPVILAKAGVLENKKSTVWDSTSDKSGIKIVIQDGKIITANGPQAAQEFGEKLLLALRC
ncbi:MAG: DJ-1/PfpI family protein [Patescibacteria group bacterium]